LLLLALLVGHQVLLLPGNLFGNTLQNVLHLPAFAALGFVLAWYLRGLGGLQILAACAVVAVGFEASQIFTARRASIGDLTMDMSGAALGVAMLRTRKPVAIAAVLVVVLVSVAVPGRVWLAYRERDALFPAFLEVDSALRSPLVRSNGFMSVIPIAQTGMPALRVCWADGRYPGLHFNEVVSDWNGFDELFLSFVVDAGEEMALTVAVGHVGVRGTSAYLTRRFEAGLQEWVVPLEALVRDEMGEPVGISHLIVHSAPEHKGRCVDFLTLEVR
jgi:hypothetical protein